MFNFSGSEIVFLLLIALIILGPEKLPEAVRKFGKTYGEFKKVTSGFQAELKQALDEPMREMRETADAFKKAASFDLDADPVVDPPTLPAEPLPGDAAPAGSAAASDEPASIEPAPDAMPGATGLEAVEVDDAPARQAPTRPAGLNFTSANPARRRTTAAPSEVDGSAPPLADPLTAPAPDAPADGDGSPPGEQREAESA